MLKLLFPTPIQALFVTLCCLLTLSCANRSADTEVEVTLLYSGNLDGELEPCGCSAEGDLGGIQRRATVVDKFRESGLQPILISTGGLFKPEIEADQIKDRFILTGLQNLAYDGIGVQWLDLAHGEGLLLESKLPFVASNWHSTQFSASRSFKRQGQVFHYFHWLDPDTSPYKNMTGSTLRVSGDSAPIADQMKAAKSRGEVVVLGTTLGLSQAQSLFPLESIDILLVQSRYELLGDPQLVGNTLVLQPGSRGQRMGKVSLKLSGGRINEWSHEEILLPASVADAPKLANWYDEYNDALRVDYKERVAKRQALEGSSPFAGDAVCAGCHQQAHTVWSGSKHAAAFSALEKVGKTFDPNCVGCHTVGYDQPGGFLDIDLTPHLTNVQCETCHGAGKSHVDSGGQSPLPVRTAEPQAVCARCHYHEHSPSFSFETYWPQIKHSREQKG